MRSVKRTLNTRFPVLLQVMTKSCALRVRSRNGCSDIFVAFDCIRSEREDHVRQDPHGVKIGEVDEHGSAEVVMGSACHVRARRMDMNEPHRHLVVAAIASPRYSNRLQHSTVQEKSRSTRWTGFQRESQLQTSCSPMGMPSTALDTAMSPSTSVRLELQSMRLITVGTARAAEYPSEAWMTLGSSLMIF